MLPASYSGSQHEAVWATAILATALSSLVPGITLSVLTGCASSLIADRNGSMTNDV